MESFKEFILSSGASPEIVEKYTKRIRHKRVKKGMKLQFGGEHGHKSFFVKKGLLRSYIIDHKGKEHVYMFAPEGWVIGDITSYAYDSPTELYIDALEDSELDVIDVNSFSEFNDFPKEALKAQIEKLTRRVAVLQRRVLMLMSARAVDRYNDFVKTYPNIIQRVPQKMIASYLGITPEALSKIRGEIARGKLK